MYGMNVIQIAPPFFYHLSTDSAEISEHKVGEPSEAMFAELALQPPGTVDEEALQNAKKALPAR